MRLAKLARPDPEADPKAEDFSFDSVCYGKPLGDLEQRCDMI